MIEATTIKQALEGVDFIDFGCSDGGSMRFAVEKLGGRKGLGIDISLAKVNAARASGLHIIQGDATALTFPDRCVEFSVVSHFLEHLDTLETARKVVEEAIRVARRFVLIQGPFFDSDDYLRALGLKMYYSDWRGHTLKLTTAGVAGILESLGVEKYSMLGVGPVESSRDPFIHPWNSPQNQQRYDASLHPPKPSLEFGQPVFKEMICYVDLGDSQSLEKLRSAKPRAVTLDPVFLPRLAALPERTTP